jgi:hypothetical protein
MGSCIQECVTAYLADQDLCVQGNKIFKKINTKLDISDNNLKPEEKKGLQECMKFLEEAEKVRIEIAKKFETFLFNTGACVLTQPTFERGLMTFIINLLTQIMISAKEKKVKFDPNDISFDKFIFISTNVPFIELNKNILNSLKKKYNFDFYKNDSLMKAFNSSIDFLSTVPSTKSILENQVIILQKLIADSITHVEMLDQLTVSIDAILFLIDFFTEIKNGIIETQIKLTKPNKINKFLKIAENASEKNIKDPKKIALVYSFGDNCGNINNWMENMTYKEFYPLKY